MASKCHPLHSRKHQPSLRRLQPKRIRSTFTRKRLLKSTQQQILQPQLLQPQPLPQAAQDLVLKLNLKLHLNSWMPT